jgi:transposase-like protein
MEYAVKTLQEAICYFTDLENCRKFMVSMRWPDGVPRCPYCDATKLTWLAKDGRYRCYGDHKPQKFSLKVGTVFEDSPIGLDKWLPAAWLLCNSKNGISSYEVARSLGVTQKTAWFMMHRIRLAMLNKSFYKMGGSDGGPVEIKDNPLNDSDRFMLAISQISGKRLTYAELTGKVGETEAF